MIIPRPKQYKSLEGVFTSKIVLNENCGISVNVQKLLNAFSPATVCTLGANPNLHFEKDQFEKTGAYRLSVTEKTITIAYGDEEGIRNAVASLVQLKGEWGFACAEITDAPDNAFRSGMLDLARGYVELPVLKEHIVRMAFMKFNYLHLHLMDRQSYVLESDVVPNPAGYRQYTKSEMRGMIAFCKLLGLEIIPEIEIPAHAVNLLKALPQLECDIVDMDLAVNTIKSLTHPKTPEFTDPERYISMWAVCAGKESTYEIYERIIREITELFDGTYLHIGGDELEYRQFGAYPHWDNCRCCIKKMQEEGITNNREMYYYVVRRIYDIVKPMGKKLIMWNDQVDVLLPVEIPNDIVIEYWNGAVVSPEDGVFQKLLDMGFEIINAHLKYTYVDLPEYMQEKGIRAWDTHTFKLDEPKLTGNIPGGEMCAWELGNPEFAFYAYTLPVCMALFADRVWNDVPAEYDEAYKASVFSAMIGVRDCGFHPFGIFDEMIPARKRGQKIYETMDLSKIDSAQLQNLLCSLKKFDKDTVVYGKYALQAYIDCFTSLADRI